MTPSPITPFGDISNENSKKSFINIIHLLSAAFPAHDCSLLTPANFKLMESTYRVRMDIDSSLAASIGCAYHSVISPKLWEALDEDIILSECNVYSLHVPADLNPLSTGSELWSWLYIFENRRRKRVILFTCSAVPISFSQSTSAIGGFDPSLFIGSEDLAY
ncbi:Repressor of RNA polymerase III transcription Maf1 like protein [Aduncisulcus paluster]|uniref:Repressor of RNA polymerase III transcription Maf1 like protein n=1 Tax=Aduncisulcus paluster TaxID=2918883 RepID=A0ABQ5KJL7_9EUKA|nr:Repressor of RNA polymerase III transcription Maf1 like protein [Aduncisulcus paluster]